MPNTQFLSTMYDTRPLNTRVRELPQMYAGHNAELLYNNIGLRQQRTKRFPGETDLQYAARIGQEITRPLVGRLDFDSTYAFRVTPSRLTYNAKDQIMQARCDIKPVLESGQTTSRKAFVIRHQPQVDNTYTVTDKDGVKRTVEEKKFNEYGIIPVTGMRLPNAVSDPVEISFRMDPADAKKFQGSMNVLIIGTLETPSISYEEINRSPTAENPGTYLAKYYYLHIKLTDIWFYDAPSGKIIKKLGDGR
ncbi:MAG: hypothetical protein ABFD12_05525 [Syntrophorhabdus sp.]